MDRLCESAYSFSLVDHGGELRSPYRIEGQIERIMDRDAVFQKVVGILKPFVKDEDALAGASESTSILEDLKVNSARLVDIILALEDEFDIEVDDESADKVQTLKDAVDVILEKAA
ncbi:MAG: phosphopantetheine-binding protein [Planctomycetota bacterium]